MLLYNVEGESVRSKCFKNMLVESATKLGFSGGMFVVGFVIASAASFLHDGDPATAVKIGTIAGGATGGVSLLGSLGLFADKYCPCNYANRKMIYPNWYRDEIIVDESSAINSEPRVNSIV